MNKDPQHILVISPYSECKSKLDQYSKSLIDGFSKKFSTKFKVSICAVTTEEYIHSENKEVLYRLNANKRQEYFDLAENINLNNQITSVFIQHELELYDNVRGENLLLLLYSIKKPLFVYFNNLPTIAEYRYKELLINISSRANAIIVNNQIHKTYLTEYYQADSKKIEVINQSLLFDESSIGLTTKEVDIITKDKTVLTYANLVLKHSKNSNIEFIIPEISLETLTKFFNNEQYGEYSPKLDSATHILEIVHSIYLYSKVYGEIYNLKTIEISLSKIEECINHHSEQITLNKKSSEKEENDIALCFSALAMLLSLKEGSLNETQYSNARAYYQKSLEISSHFTDLTAQATQIKGLYLCMDLFEDQNIKSHAVSIADKLIDKYYRNTQIEEEKAWTENFYQTANSKFSEALLYAYLISGVEIYKVIAIVSFDWLIANLFRNGYLTGVSNATDLSKDFFGCKPTDIKEVISTFYLFSDVFKDELYSKYLKIAFSWFAGNNSIQTAIYYSDFNICFEGISDQSICAKISPSSEINYLISRLIIELDKLKNQNKLVVKKQNEKEILFDEK
ncbi:MAG: hypothetical protein M3Q58_09115 [Bacteroidota bacterium]|nr:hypothetical protein [Bacteroidota bacterium]